VDGHPHGQHLSAMTRGCLAGTSVCFVSNEGRVYPCGYLPVSAGDTRIERFADIWNDSPVFRDLRESRPRSKASATTAATSHCAAACRARALRRHRQLPRRGALLLPYQPEPVRRPVALQPLTARS
jgi:radical SAM protein with 4Fe4S-binding SPASM domain